MLPLPRLDDRDYHELLTAARRRVTEVCPAWTDLSPSDPGAALLESFAYLTDLMLYRLNRLPELAYVELLGLLGVRRAPPAAARVALEFSLDDPAPIPTAIPRGTRVATGRTASTAEAVVFATVETATIAAGSTTVAVEALHSDVVSAEPAGTGTGLPGQWVRAGRAPIVAPSGDGLDLVVGVEAAPGELAAGDPAIEQDDRAFRVWREVDGFADVAAGDHVYVADRTTGTITFAPALRPSANEGTLADGAVTLAAVPPAGRQIRLWYRHGGGSGGNVAAGTLTVLRDAIAGVSVTNPSPATGGRAAETLEHALARGPQAFRTARRAVTVDDIEHLAVEASGAIVRAKAVAPADVWAHAERGSVDVIVVPALDDGEAANLDGLQARHTEASRAQVQQQLERRRPLGVDLRVSWARYKVVSVAARVVIGREEDAGAVSARLSSRLARSLTPIPTASSGGWPFGQALRTSHVYELLLGEPGVRFVDRVRLVVEHVPGAEVTSLAADAHQPHTWYAAAADTVYRSGDDGEGWELASRFSGETAVRVRVLPGRAGLVGLVTHGADGASAVYVSQDCGETWSLGARTRFSIEDLAWVLRDGAPLALLATDAGVFELAMTPDATPVPVAVDASTPDRPAYAVACGDDARGVTHVAVAFQGTAGIHVSNAAGASGSFRAAGLDGHDIRVLAMRRDGPRTFLWAGAFAAGANDAGEGCFVRELLADGDSPDGWQPRATGWTAGSCRSIAFFGGDVVAATHRGGVLRSVAGQADAGWQPADVRGGLPLRDAGRFDPVTSVAGDPAGRVVLAGGGEGVFRSPEAAVWRPVAGREFTSRVTLPRTWLLCSGSHALEVVSEDAATGD